MDDKIELTPEQLAEVRAFLQKNDITANMAVKREYNFKGDKAKVFKRAKEIFGEYWLGNLKSLGVNRMMKNFSKDFPVNFLENADADWLGLKVAEIDSSPEMMNEYIGMMFDIYAEPIEKGLIGYAGQLGKSVDDLTDAEILFVVEKVAEVAGEVTTNVLMQGQQVPALYNISKDIPQHEDFSVKLTADKINFLNKWTHYKTKLGAPLFFSELSEEEANGIEGAKDFFASADSETQKEYEELRDSFADTLNSTDREIYYLKEKGYTQAEIASRLGYKTHSAVTKRLAAMKKNLDEFLGNIEQSSSSP